MNLVTYIALGLIIPALLAIIYAAIAFLDYSKKSRKKGRKRDKYNQDADD